MVSVTCVLAMPTVTAVTMPTVAAVLAVPTVTAVVVPAVLGVALGVGVLTACDVVGLAAVCAVA